jgi:hypothetical protein
LIVLGLLGVIGWWVVGCRGGAGGRPRTVLVTGLDRDGRADTILLVSTTDKATHIIALPRDWRQADGRKLNAQSLRLGPQRFATYVGTLLHIRIDHYLAVPFTPRLARVFDRACPNGIYVDIGKAVHYRDRCAGFAYSLPKAGLRHGADVLWILRDRQSAQGDAIRITRARLVAHALLRELARPKNLPRVPGLARDLLQVCQTDVTAATAAGYLLDVVRSREHCRVTRLQGRPCISHGQEFLELTPAQIQPQVHLAMTGVPVPDALVLVVENASTRNGQAAAMARALRTRYGFDRITVGQSPLVFHRDSDIAASPEAIALARVLGRELRLRPQRLPYPTVYPTIVIHPARNWREL